MSGPPDPISSVIRGVVSGTLDSVPERIHALALKILEHQTAFVRDPVSLSAIRGSRKIEEYRVYKAYVHDPELLKIIRLGLALRQMPGEEAYYERVRKLKTVIHSKLGTQGLRAAEVVQNGVLREFMSDLVGSSSSPADVEQGITRLLKGVERWTHFVQDKDNTTSLCPELQQRINANQPGVFIIFGHGSMVSKARTLSESVVRLLGSSYASEERVVGRTIMFFIGKLEGERVDIRLPV